MIDSPVQTCSSLPERTVYMYILAWVQLCKDVNLVGSTDRAGNAEQMEQLFLYPRCSLYFTQVAGFRAYTLLLAQQQYHVLPAT